jgi:hypothetical protein
MYLFKIGEAETGDCAVVLGGVVTHDRIVTVMV